jgi:xylose isomerase
MRTYLILREKAERFADDPDIQDALATAKVDQLAVPTSPNGSGGDALSTLGRDDPDEQHLASYGYGHERLDQLVTELLLGVR